VAGNVKTSVLILLSISLVLFNDVGVVHVAASPTNWPMFHQNLNHTGVTPDIVTPPLNLLWTYKTDAGVSSSPAVSGGIVYVGSMDDNVYALNAVTGAVVWNYTTGDHVSSSPAVSGNALYVGSMDGNVYAFAEAGTSPTTTAVMATTSAFNFSSVTSSSNQPSPLPVTGASGTMAMFSQTNLLLIGVVVVLVVGVLVVVKLRRPKSGRRATGVRGETIYCRRCGAQNSTSQQFCENCGAKLKP